MEVDSVYASVINDSVIEFHKVKIVNDSIILEDLKVPSYDYFSKDTLYQINSRTLYHPYYPIINSDNTYKCQSASYKFGPDFFRDTTNNFSKCKN